MTVTRRRRRRRKTVEVFPPPVTHTKRPGIVFDFSVVTLWIRARREWKSFVPVFSQYFSEHTLEKNYCSLVTALTDIWLATFAIVFENCTSSTEMSLHGEEQA